MMGMPSLSQKKAHRGTGARGVEQEEPVYQKELTLAQKFGLVEKPPTKLTTEEWEAVHQQSAGRNDSACAICREDFKDEEQILLSCSHVFHRQCLLSFEKFAKQACCPLCRAKEYQKKRIDDGIRLYRRKCAARIQAAWRGFVTRRWYVEYLDSIPPEDPDERRHWLAGRMEERSNRMLEEMDTATDVDALFAEIDGNLAASKQVWKDLDKRAGIERTSSPPPPPVLSVPVLCGDGDVEEEDVSGVPRHALPQYLFDVPLVAAPMDEGETGEDAQGAASATASSSSSRPQLHSHSHSTAASRVKARRAAGAGAAAAAAAAAEGGVDWDKVVTRALERGDTDCPICIGPLERGSTGAEGGGEGGGGDTLAWLSCSHVFHHNCLLAFEQFSAAKGQGCSCPVCRSEYKKKAM